MLHLIVLVLFLVLAFGGSLPDTSAKRELDMARRRAGLDG